MRISDWSSDVCSSDLRTGRRTLLQRAGRGAGDGDAGKDRQVFPGALTAGQNVVPLDPLAEGVLALSLCGAVGAGMLHAPDVVAHAGLGEDAEPRHDGRREGKECVRSWCFW